MNALPVMHAMLALPELALALCGLAILVFGVLRRGDAAVICTMLVLGAFLLTALLVLGGPSGVAFGGLLIADAFSRFAQLLILAGAALSLILSLEYNRRQGIARFEFPLLILFCTVGMMVMASANNLMTLYIGLELQSLSIYVLAAFARDDLRSAEAGLKYFVLGALASGLLLYGVSLVYGFAGSMQYGSILAGISGGAASPGLIVGMVFVIVGLLFKISAVPFHMWTPDVYQGAPTPVTAFMGTAPKVAAMVLLLRVLMGPFGHILMQWQLLIELVSIASMLVGSVAAIGQRNVKRLLAYSSIGHMGYALIGLAAGSEAGLRGVLIYLVVYVFMSAGSFACVIAMQRNGRALDQISDLAGLARTDPALALVMAVMMFSMAGIPPLSGFFGKLYVFMAAVQSGLWALAIIGVLTSVIGAFYYLRVIKIMYFDPTDAALERPAFDRRAPSVSFVAMASAAFTLLFFLVPGPFVAGAQAAAKILLSGVMPG